MRPAVGVAHFIMQVHAQRLADVPVALLRLAKLDRQQAITGLANLRSEWEEALSSDGLNLAEQDIALFLNDVAEAIGLTPLEIVIVMGHIQLGMAVR